MAYNEERNIGRMLEALLNQETSTCAIDEIIVLASGCTDKTEAIVEEYAKRDARIRLITQARREGKASAVNLFLRRARCDILVSATADTVPEPTTIQRLVEPFRDPEVGMTGGRPIPVNDPRTFLGFAAHLLWDTHHRISLSEPKLGELTAFRRVFHRIPTDSAVDEANMEPLVRGQGFRLKYIPEAVVRNRGPDTVRDFLKQRRRIYAGHLRMRHEQGYSVATLGPRRVVAGLMRSARADWRFWVWTPAVVGLETYARFLGFVDYRVRRRDHAIWDIATSTKGAIQ
jgi:cellulose synthase/poly-beta-1,6-N-acetylglucosamine synthase-like glycosyltransferase